MPWACRLELDAELLIERVDEPLCRRFGCDPALLIGQRLDDLFSRRDRRAQRQFYEALSRAEESGLDLLITLQIGSKALLTRLQMAPCGAGWRAEIEPLLGEGNLIYQLY